LFKGLTISLRKKRDLFFSKKDFKFKVVFPKTRNQMFTDFFTLSRDYLRELSFVIKGNPYRILGRKTRPDKPTISPDSLVNSAESIFKAYTALTQEPVSEHLVAFGLEHNLIDELNRSSRSIDKINEDINHLLLQYFQ
jgi:hypothetical protein